MMMNMEIMLWSAENGGDETWAEGAEGGEVMRLLFYLSLWLERSGCCNPGSHALCRIHR